jgi:succinyl-CoA synthetase beta subunit
MFNSFQLIIACSKGGTSIEDLAEKYPDMIIKVIYFFCLQLLFEINVYLTTYL